MSFFLASFGLQIGSSIDHLVIILANNFENQIIPFFLRSRLQPAAHHIAEGSDESLHEGAVIPIYNISYFLFLKIVINILALQTPFLVAH